MSQPPFELPDDFLSGKYSLHKMPSLGQLGARLAPEEDFKPDADAEELAGAGDSLSVIFRENEMVFRTITQVEAKNLAGKGHLSVARFDVIVASNLMRTDISRSIRQRARDLKKTWGYCRNQGLATITSSVLNAVNLHLARKTAAS